MDIEVPVSKGLLDQIASVGGSAEGSPDPARIVTATVPFSALKALAARADVHTISVAERIATSGMKIRSEISGNGNADQ